MLTDPAGIGRGESIGLLVIIAELGQAAQEERPQALGARQFRSGATRDSKSVTSWVSYTTRRIPRNGPVTVFSPTTSTMPSL